MNPMQETVVLPDPAVQPLVHPLDLPEARRLFRWSRVVAALTSPPAALLTAALIGYAGRNFVVPAVVLVVLVVTGALAGRWLSDRAWDYIPRNRQDRDRPLPQRWEVASAAVLALVLGAALLVVVFRLGRDDVDPDVRAFTFGMCVVVALLVFADVTASLMRPARRRQAVAALPGVLVVTAVTVVAYPVWFEDDVDGALLIGGAASMTAIAALVLGGRRWIDRLRAGR
ncbi:hypothetical protein [Actinoplanes sp. DH11]|uniref:hypothetical protein n=1 Tax=Actinoplanes sp. DH11 TaxID=2857011 RepID=UPI001E65D389|nr:hypothetical protein [Actinoplanes sp. DH11]